MRLTLLVLASLFALPTPTFAQATMPAPATAPASAATPAPDMTKDGKPKANEVREACRDEAKTKGLKGDGRFKAVSDCFVKERPDLASKEQCRMDGHAKGLKKDELKAFVKDCAKTKG